MKEWTCDWFHEWVHGYNFQVETWKKLRHLPSGQERDEASKIKELRNSMASLETGNS